jgi:hypothetical protein
MQMSDITHTLGMIGKRCIVADGRLHNEQHNGGGV